MNRLLSFALLMLCVSIAACGQELVNPTGPLLGEGAFAAVNPSNLLPGDGITSIAKLDQNWSDAESRWFYNVPQGSQMLPYRWFLHLEQPDNNKPFLDADHIRALGYLPRSPDEFGNPDGLPIGFVRDAPFPDGMPALGLTCAVCHTNQINYKGVAWLVDGAPTLGDIATFQRRLHAALRTTIDDEDKFERFADNVLPLGGTGDRTELIQQMRRFEAQRRQFNERNLPATGAPPFGHGRVDAFAAIMNEVTANFLRIPENVRPPSAPVSYPHLWDTPQHDFVQWNGTATNSISAPAALVLGTRRAGALGRNAGAVLGVFGSVNVNTDSLLGGYASSANQRALIDIEDLVLRLWSPVWPSELGAIDGAKRDSGRVLFNEHCAECHTNNGIEYNFDRTDPNRFVIAKMLSVETDSEMYLSFALRKAKTGILEGRRRTFISLFDRLGPEEPAVKLMKHVLQRVMLGWVLDRDSADAAQLPDSDYDAPLDVSFKTTEGVLTGSFKSIVANEDNTTFLVSGEDICFTPNAATLPDAGMLALCIEDDGAARLHGPAESYAADRFKTLSTIRRAVEMSDSRPSTLQLKVDAESIMVKYKARPLNGIWATAPYLHNGSVPNLWELLQAADQREKTFFVGSREFDSDNVGFESDDGPFEFDTTKPGNSNAGHEFGTMLSNEEKQQLIEYVKSL